MAGSGNDKLIQESETSPERKRKELRFIICFVIVSLLAPLFFADLYPFSRYWHFADSPKMHTEYWVRDVVRLSALDPVDYGLQPNYESSYPFRNHGSVPAFTINQPGRVESAELIINQVQKVLSSQQKILSVDVMQRVYAQDYKNDIMLLKTTIIRIERP